MNSEFWNFLGLQKPVMEYCEKAGGGIIARPGYFISNFAYIIIGFILLTKKRKISKAFGIFAILIGVASGIYDASYRANAQFLDVTVMFGFVIFLFCLNLQCIFNLNVRKLVLLYILFIIVYLLFADLFFTKGAGLIPFGAGVVGVIASQLYIWFKLDKNTYSANNKIWIASFVIFFAGYLIWQFDAHNIICDKFNLFNGRGIFHYLTSIVILLLSNFYCSINYKK